MVVGSFWKKEGKTFRNVFYFFDKQKGILLKYLSFKNRQLYCTDSNFIYYASHDSLYAVNQSTAQTRYITSIDDYTISYLTKNGNNLYLQAIGDDDTLDCPIYKVDIASGKATKLMGNVHGKIQQVVQDTYFFVQQLHFWC